jgi:hypothetical protein
MKREGQERLYVVPITWKTAVAFVDKHHRHHGGARGQKWAIGARADGYPLWGVAQCGRPSGRNVSMKYGSGSVWDGKPLYESWYA